jgi:GNAT superfamily N-acetyltransferase
MSVAGLGGLVLDAQVQFRAIRQHELDALLGLYKHLHSTDAPLPSEDVILDKWEEFLGDPNIHCLVAECDGKLVASCTLAIIPNLTRGMRPYGLIENVVTHAMHRRKGIGKQVLHAAVQLAWERDCYKVMLLTGSKDDGVYRFYEQAGFRRGIKTGFIVTAEPS